MRTNQTKNHSESCCVRILKNNLRYVHGGRDLRVSAAEVWHGDPRRMAMNMHALLLSHCYAAYNPLFMRIVCEERCGSPSKLYWLYVILEVLKGRPTGITFNITNTFYFQNATAIEPRIVVFICFWFLKALKCLHSNVNVSFLVETRGLSFRIQLS